MIIEFIGEGLVPVGGFLFKSGDVHVYHSTPVLISAIHKTIRRNMSKYLKWILKFVLKALSRRDKTSGIKSVYKQVENRLLMSVIEDGVVIFTLPSDSQIIIRCILSIFSANTLKEQFLYVDKLCSAIHNKYRGRLPSCLITWFLTNKAILDKLNIRSPPDNQELNTKILKRISNFKLNTLRDKRIFKDIIYKIDKDALWILNLIDIVSHSEFNLFLYISAVLSKYGLNKILHNTVDLNIIIPESFPPVELLKNIGVYDCHSGRGTFKEFLERGMLVENIAPSSIKFMGNSTKDFEIIYYNISKEVGSDKYI
tara:strand:- start:7970 stop:8905 length:936 start_codon:yes stop_codon:yes gene_type:complete